MVLRMDPMDDYSYGATLGYPGYMQGYGYGAPSTGGYLPGIHSYASPQPNIIPSPLPPPPPNVQNVYPYDEEAAAEAANLPSSGRRIANANVPTNGNQIPPSLTTDEPSFGRLQYFLPIITSKRKLHDEERDPFSVLPDSLGISDAIQKKLNTRTYTMDMVERGIRSPPLHILQTRCISPEEDGQETIILTVDNAGAEEKQVASACEMRWIHIRSDNPNLKADAIGLDHFEMAVTQTPSVDRHDRDLISELFKKVKEKHERTFIHGKYLDPAITRYDAKYVDDTNAVEREPKSATFFAIPYFSAEEFCCHYETGTELHPVRNLLQTHYELESTQSRDNHQVLKRIGALQNPIHVPQLWCLLLNQDTIITCAPGDISSLFGNTIEIKDVSAATKAIGGSTIVRLSDPNGQIYFLPSEKCQTWFGLLAAIGKELTPITDLMVDDERPYGWELLFDDEERATAENWTDRTAACESIHVNLTLRWKYPALYGAPAPNLSAQPPYPSSLSHIGAGYPGYGPYSAAPTSNYMPPAPNSSPYHFLPQGSTPGTAGPRNTPFENTKQDEELEEKLNAIEKLITSQKILLHEAREKLVKQDNNLSLLRQRAESHAVASAAAEDDLRSCLEKVKSLEEEVLSIRKAATEYGKEMCEKIQVMIADEESKVSEEVEKHRVLLLKQASPVEFRDCIGRYFRLPYASCLSWLDIEFLIKQAFSHIEPIGRIVLNGWYDLLVDDEIILPMCWEHLVESGWNVTMHLWPPQGPFPDSFVTSDSSWSTAFSSMAESDSWDDVGSVYSDWDTRSEAVTNLSTRPRRPRRQRRLSRAIRPTRHFRPFAMKAHTRRNTAWTSDAGSVPSQRRQRPVYESSEHDGQNWTTQESSEFSYSVEESSDSSDPETQRKRRQKQKGIRVVDVTEADDEDLQLDVTTNSSRSHAPLQREEELSIGMVIEEGASDEIQQLDWEVTAEETKAIVPYSAPLSNADDIPAAVLEDWCKVLKNYIIYAESRYLDTTFNSVISHMGYERIRPDIDEGRAPPLTLRFSEVPHSEDDQSSSVGLEIISVHNFWWERYKFFLSSVPVLVDESSPRLHEDSFGATTAPILQDEPESMEKTHVSSPEILEQSSGHETDSGEVPNPPKGSVSQGPVGASHGVSAPGLSEPKVRTRTDSRRAQSTAAYMYEVDDYDRPVRGSKRRATTIKIQDFPSPPSSRSDSLLSDSLSGVHVSEDPNLTSSDDSEDAWGYYPEIQPSDSVSIGSQGGNGRRRSSRRVTIRKGKEKEVETKSDGSMASTVAIDSSSDDVLGAHPRSSSFAGPSTYARPSTSTRPRATTSARPRATTSAGPSTSLGSKERLARRFGDTDRDQKYPPGYRQKSHSDPPGNPLMPLLRPPSNDPPDSFPPTPVQNPVLAPSSYNPPGSFPLAPPQSLIPPPSSYPSYHTPSFYPQSSPFPSYFSSPSSYSYPSYEGYPNAPTLPPMEIDLADTTAEIANVYYTPSTQQEKHDSSKSTNDLKEKNISSPKALQKPSERADGGSRPPSMFQRLEEKVKVSISERLAARHTNMRPAESTRPPPMPSNNSTTTLPPIFRWPIEEEDDADDTTGDSVKSPGGQTIDSSRSAPKFSQPKEDPILTILSDAQEQLNRYLAHFPNDLKAFNTTLESTPERVESLKQEILQERRGVKAAAERELLLEVAERVLYSFVPPNTPGLLVGRFWGSLENITRAFRTHPRRDLSHMTSRALRYLKVVEEIQNGVSARPSASSSDKPRYRITTAFLPAFEHLVVVFCIFGKHTEHDAFLVEAEARHHRRCEDLLLKAKNQLIRIHAGHTSEGKLYKAVDSEGLVALMFKQLVHISSRDGKPNILVEYQKYMSKLELKVLKEPTVRVYDYIQDLVQELSIIENIMRQQHTVFEASLALYNKTAKLPDALSLVILKKGLQDIQKQLNNVTELLLLAENKKALLSQAINVRKETNNQAILVFTVMTVVFLPLSFMTSYLGMNSTDIRNGAFTQLRFWELAIPLTAVVLLAVWVLVRFKRILGRGMRGAIRGFVQRVVQLWRV